MDQQTSERLNHLMASIETEWKLAVALFIILSMSLTLLIKKRNGISLKEAALFAIGVKKVKTTWMEKTLHIATLIVPLAIIVFAIQFKNAT